MLSPKLKPYPRIPAPRPKPQVGRIPKRPIPMTLIAAFRCRNGGILLCADREENDGYAKREVDKIYRVPLLIPCEFFIAGAGPTSIITNACNEIHRSIKQAADNGTDVLVEHEKLLKDGLKSIHKQYAKTLLSWPMSLIIVVAPRAGGTVPLLYRTEGEILIPEPIYTAHGSGKVVCDYLADRLFEYDRIDKSYLALLAAFIFREAERSATGVGLGANMIFIHEGNKSLHILEADAVKEIEAGIPSLADALHSYWKDHAKVPEWLV